MASRIPENLTAFILAAGIGSRLGKLTENKPKALIEVNGTPMINILINRLLYCKFNNFVVNIHHRGQMLRQYLDSHYPNLQIKYSDETSELLDTGGAITHAYSLLKQHDNFLVHNVDIILPCDIQNMLLQHLDSKSITTLAVSQRESKRNLLFDTENRLCGWINLETGEIKKAKNYTKNHKLLAYSGVQWISSQFFDLEKRLGKFSIIDSWLDICHIKPITAYEHSEKGWFDLGTENKIETAEKALRETNRVIKQ